MQLFPLFEKKLHWKEIGKNADWIGNFNRSQFRIIFTQIFSIYIYIYLQGLLQQKRFTYHTYIRIYIDIVVFVCKCWHKCNKCSTHLFYIYIHHFFWLQNRCVPLNLNAGNKIYIFGFATGCGSHTMCITLTLITSSGKNFENHNNNNNKIIQKSAKK